MTFKANPSPSPASDDIVTEALASYPLQETPPTFSAGLMTRLNALPANVRPRFRLSWFDWAISLFTTGMAGLGFVLWQTLPPQVVAQLQVTWMLWMQHASVLLPH